MSIQWLRAVECPLLQVSTEDVDPTSLRLVQRLMEIALSRSGCDELAPALLEEVAATLRADHAGIWEATPPWKSRWSFQRPGVRFQADAIPKALLNEVLDRTAGCCQPSSGNTPALALSCLSFVERPNRVLLVTRARERFADNELEFTVAAGHYIGVTLEKERHFDQAVLQRQRLQALLSIGKQLAQERETVPLLEHIADNAAKLLGCERASIFLWDKNRKELVGRPALGMPNNELRIPEDTGIVGKTVRTGQPQVVHDVRDDTAWSSKVDRESGFKTRNLLCVPMRNANGDVIGAVEVMNRAGNYTDDDTSTLSLLGDQIVAALDNVRELEAIMRSNQEMDAQARLAARIIGESEPIRALRSTVERVARTDLPVIILGESGTGKDVVARAVHYSSPRQHQPYIPVNCAAIAESLLESELFGHEKGAFTDAHQTRAGKFEAASGGTLFLDEIGDLSAGGQAKLLRVLEEKVVYRVGGVTPIPVDTRIIAATNRNLAESVRANRFREDLFYRLTVVTLELPPLRDRRDDVLVLAEHFLASFCKEAGRKPLKFTAEAKKRLQQHEWPGNVRELRNLLERVAYLCSGDKVDVADLAFILRPAKDEVGGQYAQLSMSDATDAFQRDHIHRAIERAGGNVSDAAKLLGLYRPNLYRKMKLLGMNAPKD